MKAFFSDLRLTYSGRWILGFAFVLITSLASAAKPVVSSLSPTGVRRGETTTIKLSGTRLQDARQVLLEHTGIEINEVKPIDNSNVEVTLTVAADLSPGLYPIRLVTETGISNMRLLGVGAMPVVAEVEPNSSFTEPQSIAMNVTVEGIVQREDEDYFAVDLKAGQTLTCEVEGIRLSYFPQGNANFFDPFVAILDANRFEKATSDDNPFVQQDAVCSFVAPEDGRYVVVVRDSSFGGDGSAQYRLHVGEFPRPVAMVPAGGRPGETITANFVGVDGSQWQSQVTLPDTASPAYPIAISNDRGVAPSPNMVRLQPMTNVIEQEPNNNVREPQKATEPLALAFCGTISEPGDVDCYAFEAKKGQKISTRLYARSVLRSPLDGVTDIYDPEFKRIGGNDDSGGPDPFAEFTAAADGMYTISIRDHLGQGGPEYAYRLEVEVAAPGITLSLPEETRDEAMTIEVPRGTQTAFMVNAARREFGGDLDLMLENLPLGVTATTIPMPASLGSIPLILTATADAPLAANLVDLSAKNSSGTPEVVGHLIQRHKLVAGQNRVDVYGYDSERAAVAVVNTPPATIELVQPTVPVVRNGNAFLKVVAHRQEGFKGAIPVRLLYVPSGISTNNSLSIPAEQNEVLIPITANGSAALGTWPMIAVGFADVGNGSLKISSQSVELTVAEPFFNFTFNKASVEQGTKAEFLVGVEVARPFEGTAELKLVGFPAGVTSPADVQPLTPESTESVFPIEIAADSRPGNHKTLNVQAIIHAPGGDIIQTIGTGEIQVNQPLPAPTTPPPAPAAKPAEPEKPKEAPPKPLSRIEQLRLQKEQAASGG